MSNQTIIASNFIFKDYKVKKDNQSISFSYSIEFVNKESLEFTEEIIFSNPVNPETLNTQTSKNILTTLHIILGLSYYKLYIPPQISLPYQLNKQQSDFFTTIYQNGLGEFCYRNNLDLTQISTFPVSSKSPTIQPSQPQKNQSNTNNKILLGIGGGKDSIVAHELLKKQNYKTKAFILETGNHSHIADEVIKALEIDSIIVNRVLDHQIFQSHPDSYNGHIPISSIFASVGYLTAYLFGFDYIAVGNEYSSNFGNLKYQGHLINHQWSKSMEFEQLFQQFSNNYFSPHVTYFSPIRHLYEIRVVQEFAKYPQYFSHFTSCNRSFTVFEKPSDKKWCGKCPKCIFMFTLLSSFLDKEILINIFGQNLYQDQSLEQLFAEILGFGEIKPFDCVGTFEESQAALFLAKDKFKGDFIIDKFIPKLKHPQKNITKVFKVQNAPTLPEKFKLIGVNNILIIGHGKEGQNTEQYLKKYYPNIKLGITDQKNGENYLDVQSDYDFAIKTPGIHKSKITIPYTTATNIFFSQVNNQIIGVTGSKGKSTTSSLIYHILQQANKKVSLLGNIGKPMLQALQSTIDPDQIFVVELSSYQLDDIKLSPNIVVVTNLFPEHMDYHGDVQSYYQAKQNIIKYQNSKDIFIYNSNNSNLLNWHTNSKSQKIDYSKIEVEHYSTNLLGQHNQENIRAAIAAANQFNISKDQIAHALQTFQSLPHRLEFIGVFKQIKFYDDAISTTPESTIQAIKALNNVDTILLGGEDRGYNFTELVKQITNSSIRNIILFPESGKRMYQLIKDFNIYQTSSTSEAVKFAYAHTKPDSICLLSPASPSYSLWKNFEKRGNEFQNEVKNQSSK